MLKRLYEKILPSVKTNVFSNETTRQEAREASQHATEAVDQAKSRKDEVSEVTASLRSQRERNQFAYLIERTMKGNG